MTGGTTGAAIVTVGADGTVVPAGEATAGCPGADTAGIDESDTSDDVCVSVDAGVTDDCDGSPSPPTASTPRELPPSSASLVPVATSLGSDDSVALRVSAGADEVCNVGVAREELTAATPAPPIPTSATVNAPTAAWRRSRALFIVGLSELSAKSASPDTGRPLNCDLKN
ncbi:MAG: hypothetical protein IZT58_11220 [Actinobacteria bacterium]|nr:hypothetical protein [Actinomycetota bacterium]